MSPIRRIPAPASALILAAAISAGGASSAQAAVPCFKTYSAAGSGWKVQNDGSLMQSLQSNGSAGDTGHGKLVVGGAAYPKLDGNHCAQGPTSMTFPLRNLGGFTVSRSITETGGKLRWLDTITNPGQGKMLSVDFSLEVLPSQVLQTSESGNNSANEDDHWSVHKSTSLFSTHQWGQDGAIAQPDVVSEDGGALWEHDFGDMDDDATLRYSFFIGGGQTIRLLHGIGTAPTLQTATDSAKNAASLFTAYSRTVADDIVNFTDDPDADGVTKFVDECPGVKGNKADGCVADVVPPPPADPVDPDAPAPPQGGEPAPVPAPTPAPAPAPGGGGTPASAADTTGPVITVSGVGTKLRRSKLTRKSGTTATIACAEDCRYTAKLVVKPRGRKGSRTVQRLDDQRFSAAARQLRLRVKSNKLTGLAKQRVTLVIEATDRAGNRSEVEQRITLR